MSLKVTSSPMLLDLETTRSPENTLDQEKNQVNTQDQEIMKNLESIQGQEKNLENTQGQVIMKNLANTLVQEKNLESTQGQVISRNPVSTQDQEKNLVNTQEQEPKLIIDLQQIVEYFIAFATKIYRTFLTLPQDLEITKKRNLKKLCLTQLQQASLQRQMSQIGSKMVVVSLVDLPTIASQLIVLTARTCDFLDGTE